MASKAATSLSSDCSEPGDVPGLIRSEVDDSPAVGTLAPQTPAGARFSSLSGPTPSLHVRREGSALSGRVLVLNASYEPINVCTVRRAIVLILKQKAEVIDEHDLEVHAERMSMTRPAVIRLRTYVRIPYQSFRRKITRRAVFARDGWACQYCGRRGSLTMDHVIPRSKGGDTSWENVVACCATCNRRKGDRSVAQSGMKLSTRPIAPHPTIFIHVASPTIPSQWLPYVPATAGVVTDVADADAA
ncbi:MAG: HNH endonuclease [Thermoleophilaceae bacterium]|nr:HNH endonuclease [Thermoleophilaceae bacterium]